MKTPFENTLNAFEPFFDTSIRVIRKGDFDVTMNAIVLDNGFDEVFSDSGTSANRRLITVQIKRYSPIGDFCNESSMWPYPNKDPRIGDMIVLESGKRFQVYDVDIFDKTLFKISAKSSDGKQH